MMLEWAIRIGGAMAALCVLAFPLWALGIPGINDNKNDFVRGWKMGLGAIVLYPIAYIAFLITHYWRKYRLDAVRELEWERTSSYVFFFLIGALMLRLIHAFYLIARNEKKMKEKEAGKDNAT